MAVVIGTNIFSLDAQRRLGESSDSLSKSFERLSSGLRINHPSDDAAGLAVAAALTSKTRIYTQAIKNANDGISVLNVADSAVDSLTNIVTRLKELSEQSANGVYSTSQRSAIDSEAQALSAEFSRITKTTSFNGINLFDGSTANGIKLQVGDATNGTIDEHFGGAIGTGSLGTSLSYATEGFNSYAVTFGDLNGDNILDMVTAGLTDAVDGYATIRLGKGDGTFGAAISYTTESNSSRAVTLADLNGDGKLDIITSGPTDAYSGVGYFTTRFGNGDGTFGTATSYSTDTYLTDGISIADLNGDGALDIVTVGINDANDGVADVRFGTGSGTFGAKTTYATEGRRSNAVSLADLNQDGILDMVTSGFSDANIGYATVRLGTASGTFGTATSYLTEGTASRALALGDLNGDGNIDLVTAGYSGTDGYATVRFGNGTGTFGTAISYQTESNRSYALALGDLNGDGNLDIISAGYTDGLDGAATVRLGTGSGNFGTAATYLQELGGSRGLAVNDVNGDGVLDIITAGYDDLNDGYATIRLSTTQEGISPLLSFSLKTQTGALQASVVFDNALNNLTKQRGVIGAAQSRVSIALNTITNIKENYGAALSRITDVDVAAEATKLVQKQVLQQAGAAVLAQANQQPGIALQLLKSN